jgi:hypothetical protein
MTSVFVPMHPVPRWEMLRRGLLHLVLLHLSLPRPYLADVSVLVGVQLLAHLDIREWSYASTPGSVIRVAANLYSLLQYLVPGDER